MFRAGTKFAQLQKRPGGYTLMARADFQTMTGGLHTQEPDDVSEGNAFAVYDNHGTTTDGWAVVSATARQIGPASGHTAHCLLPCDSEVTKVEADITLTLYSDPTKYKAASLRPVAGISAQTPGAACSVDVLLSSTTYAQGTINLLIDSVVVVSETTVGLVTATLFNLSIRIEDGHTIVALDDVDIIDYAAETVVTGADRSRCGWSGYQQTRADLPAGNNGVVIDNFEVYKAAT